MPSVTVYDDEAQTPKREGDLTVGVNRWGQDIMTVAVGKGMPQDAKPWTRRNESGNGTIFEWDNA